jgi:hypothetical protein
MKKAIRVLSNPIAWIVFFGCTPLVILRLLQALHLSRQCDFTLYWAAGRLFLTQQNPYWRAAMLGIETSLGLPYVYPLMLCPPWVLPIVAVPAAFAYEKARIGWLAISILLDCGSLVALWHYFGGARERWWVALVVAATFLPMATAEYVGQITPLMLCFVVGFLFFLRWGWYYAAGLMLLGLGLKPHLLYLVVLAVVFWAIRCRRWAIFAGAATSVFVFSGAAFLYDPHALGYLHNTLGPATSVLTGAGGLLRIVFGAQHAWLQFVPTALGIAWFIVYWIKNRKQWNWAVHFPLVLLVSLCTAPYFWYHDFLLVAPAMIFLAVESRERLPLLLPAWLGVQCAILFCGGVSQALEATAGVLWIGFYFYAKASHISHIRSNAVLSALESGSAT